MKILLISISLLFGVVPVNIALNRYMFFQKFFRNVSGNVNLCGVLYLYLAGRIKTLLPYQSACVTAGRGSWTAGSCCKTVGIYPRLPPSSGALSSVLPGICSCRLGSPRQEQGCTQSFHTFYCEKTTMHAPDRQTFSR